MKGGWKENVRAWIDTGVTKGRMDLAVVETHNDQFMLGNDWIARFKPRIDWDKGTVTTANGTTELLGRRANLATKPKKKNAWRTRGKGRPPKYRRTIGSDNEDSDDENDTGALILQWIDTTAQTGSQQVVIPSATVQASTTLTTEPVQLSTQEPQERIKR